MSASMQGDLENEWYAMGIPCDAVETTTRPAGGKLTGGAGVKTTRPAEVYAVPVGEDLKITKLAVIVINNTVASSDSDDGEVAVSSDSEFDPAEFEVSDVDDEDAAISGGSVLTTEGPDTVQKKKRGRHDQFDDNHREYKVSRTISTTSILSHQSLRKERRRTKTWNDRELMRKAHEPVTNLVPEFPTNVFADWEDFDATLQSYMTANYLCLNVRNSESREKYNRVYQAFAEHDHLFKAYWCTHASTQASRGKDRPDRDCRYTGCEAGFTVRSVKSIVNGCVAWNVQTIQGTERRHKIFIAQISLHNHKTNQVIYDSYRGAKSRQLAPEVRHELGLLTDMKVPSPDINRYLSDKLDVILSPQQTRHILQLVLGSTTIERTKLLLDTFAESDSGNDVLLVQDQLDITCIIVMQTSAQKTCFKQWGDRLVMDWTHGTNNLDYHLGNTNLMPSPGHLSNMTRYSFDFLALDQKGETMLLVEVFKRKNLSWNNIQTVVIDKDFVE
ncbi:LOW QUALITY PROTEIN: Hypothetical protein PHPALM_6549 [Phytophthora palmivora]|uniref:ZSWIM1/3 RNaseH-like domain-containing protein n=1 Tax=Phytophthora palmivora TaxID=4796 RepID=A0A2P4YEJ1_9STRA|nr:LOW QUALITY PROTEIN: Hypothetical protein PHPALM_6549 [Phytophthora palmivora]